MYSYAVAIEEVGIDWESLGPQYDRYSVNLTGPIDRLWVDCYKQITSETRLARFGLDPLSRTVTFTCRSTDGPDDVMAVLGRLQQLVDQVNREASLAASRPPRTARAEAGSEDVTLPMVVPIGLARAQAGSEDDTLPMVVPIEIARGRRNSR